MVTKQWTAIHRKHHVACETHEDPHSPVIMGIGEIFWRGAEAYEVASQDEETMRRFGKGTPDDWLENHVYTPHAAMGIVLMLIVDITLLGPLASQFGQFR